jgi:hypothetical protein
METKQDFIKYYSRKDIEEAIVESALNREVAVKYSENGFGKRPDTLRFPQDITQLAKQGATSFHSSEELWVNPLQISSEMSKAEI